MNRNSIRTVATIVASVVTSVSLTSCAAAVGHPQAAPSPMHAARSAAVSGPAIPNTPANPNTPNTPAGTADQSPTGVAGEAAFRDLVVAVVNDVAEYWRRELPQVTGRPWTEVNYQLVDGDEVVTDASCGVAGNPTAANPTASPAFWCPASATVYLSTKWLHDSIYSIDMPGDVDGEFGVEVVVAHEFGHAIQSQLNIVAPTGATTVAPTELQADCLAGTWSADENAASPIDREVLLGGVIALATIGDTGVDPQHHGRPKERVEAFTTGFDHADPQVCTTDLAGAM